MSDEEHDRLEEIRRLWQRTVVPVEDEPERQQRRSRVVPSVARAIRKQRHRSARRLPAALAALAVAAGFAVAATRMTADPAEDARVRTVPVTQMPDDVSRVASVRGTVHLGGRRGIKQAAQDNEVSVGDSVSTERASHAKLALSRRVAVVLSERTSVALVPTVEEARRVRLDLGHLHGDVNPSPSDRPKLTVVTPDAEVRVTGTVFDVRVEQDANSGRKRSIVSVDRGRVDIRQGGISVAQVGAGEHWASAPPAEAPQVNEPAPEPSPARNTQALKKPKKSIAAKRDEPKPGTLGRENQLYQAAVLARNLGDDRGAASHFEALIRAFPRSPLRQQARVELMRAQQRQGATQAAAAAARRYLAEFPGGFARGEAEQLTALGDAR